MSLIDTLRDKVKGGRHKPYPLDDETGQLLEQFLSAYDAQGRYLLGEIGTEAEQLLALPNARRVELIKYLITEHGAGERPVVGYRSEPWLRLNNLSQLASKLFRRKLEIPEPDLIWMLKALSKQSYSHYTQSVLTATERHLQSHGLSEPIKAALRKLRRKIYHHSLGDVIDRIDVLLNDGVRPLFSQEPWGAEVLALHGGDERWRTLLAHAATARAARPAKKWLKQAQEHLGKLGNDTTVDLLGRSFEIVLAQDHTELPLNSRVDTGTMRGLIWIASLLDDKQLIDTVHRLGEYAFRKVPGVGAVSTKVGNSVIYTLGALPGIEAISRLTALRRSVKYRQARKLIGTALEKAADERGISVAMLEELAVPTYGFNSEGEFRQPFGEELTARVVLGPGGKAQISWERNNGKVQKSVPKQVRETCPDELKALRKQAKDIGKGWLAQRDRVERMMRDPVTWTVTDWQERYLNHAFMLHFARKLLWELECSGDRTTVCALDGKLADVNDEPVDPAPGSTISLWHPIGCDTKTILEWRGRLEEKGITQPFKQAHREVYILTPAERETETYSNRFAGHILRQHQAAALFQERGWSYSLQGEFDSWNSSALVLPDRDLSVEFFCEPPGDSPTSDSSIFLYLATDQVRFLDSGNEVLPLESIEPRLFSEVMRDVDLFVGVCSIGNDPNWMDSGDRPAGYNDYWQSFAWGELNESANVRRDVLAGIIPKLKIADRLSLDGRFLHVRGDMRQYRIHIGSGNIQMEPGNAYLCIVRGGRNAADRVRLPFEGDSLLSVILSKAVMLANDKKIKDRTILAQIRH